MVGWFCTYMHRVAGKGGGALYNSHLVYSQGEAALFCYDTQLRLVQLMLMKVCACPAFTGWRPMLLHAALIEMNAFCAFCRWGVGGWVMSV